MVDVQKKPLHNCVFYVHTRLSLAQKKEVLAAVTELGGTVANMPSSRVTHLIATQEESNNEDNYNINKVNPPPLPSSFLFY